MNWILILIFIFLTGSTGFSGYFFQAFLKKAWKPQSPSAIKTYIINFKTVSLEEYRNNLKKYLSR
jgi:hypothetical protein